MEATGTTCLLCGQPRIYRRSPLEPSRCNPAHLNTWYSVVWQHALICQHQMAVVTHSVSPYAHGLRLVYSSSDSLLVNYRRDDGRRGNNDCSLTQGSSQGFRIHRADVTVDLVAGDCWECLYAALYANRRSLCHCAGVKDCSSRELVILCSAYLFATVLFSLQSLAIRFYSANSACLKSGRGTTDRLLVLELWVGSCELGL